MHVNVYRRRGTYVAVVGWLDCLERILARSVGPQRSTQPCLSRIVDWPAVVSCVVGVIKKHLDAGGRFTIRVDDGPAYVNARAGFLRSRDFDCGWLLRLGFGLMARTRQTCRHRRTTNCKNTKTLDKASTLFYVMDSSRHEQVFLRLDLSVSDDFRSDSLPNKFTGSGLQSIASRHEKL